MVSLVLHVCCAAVRPVIETAVVRECPAAFTNEDGLSHLSVFGPWVQFGNWGIFSIGEGECVWVVAVGDSEESPAEGLEESMTYRESRDGCRNRDHQGGHGAMSHRLMGALMSHAMLVMVVSMSSATVVPIMRLSCPLVGPRSLGVVWLVRSVRIFRLGWLCLPIVL